MTMPTKIISIEIKFSGHNCDYRCEVINLKVLGLKFLNGTDCCIKCIRMAQINNTYNLHISGRACNI